MNKILILGAHSFVASGLLDKLESLNYVAHDFARGHQDRKGNHIYGNYTQIANNQALDASYDVVINFAVLKDETLTDNINYIKSLIDFCKTHNVKKLIHFSSIMVYNYQLKKVDENTLIETLAGTYKKGYGEFKIGVDQYLSEIKSTLPFEVILVRPGYVLADNRPCPFIKKLPLGISLIKGNKKSKQPIVQRKDIHQALIKIIETEHNLPVYHFFPNDEMTKYKYAKRTVGGTILTMPQWMFKGIPFVLMKLKLMPKSLYSRFEGMYIESVFSSRLTEEKLNIKFK